MGFLKKLGRGLKKGFKKLGSNLKKHGGKILGVGLASLIPGVGGLLGKALGTGGSGFMGGLFQKGGLKAAAKHLGGKFLKNQTKGLLGQALQGGQQMPQGMPQGMPMMPPQMMGGMMPMGMTGGLMGRAMQGQMQQQNPVIIPQQGQVPLQMGGLSQHSYL